MECAIPRHIPAHQWCPLEAANQCPQYHYTKHTKKRPSRLRTTRYGHQLLLLLRRISHLKICLARDSPSLPLGADAQHGYARAPQYREW